MFKNCACRVVQIPLPSYFYIFSILSEKHFENFKNNGHKSVEQYQGYNMFFEAKFKN